MMKPMSKIWRRARLSAIGLLGDHRGLAAVEFAMIVPIMLLLFFGTVEFSSAVAVDRKVTLIARTLSDVTSQSQSVAAADLSNFFTAGCAIMYPYAGPPPCTQTNNPMTAVITELYVDPITLKARVEWSTVYQQGAATCPQNVVLTAGTVVASVPPNLLVSGTYLIYSQVCYLYKPAVAYGPLVSLGMPSAGFTLSDVAYTRPRQSNCVIYPTPTSGPLGSCPQ
jgi:Flp pilus assembly protein TadG